MSRDYQSIKTNNGIELAISIAFEDAVISINQADHVKAKDAISNLVSNPAYAKKLIDLASNLHQEFLELAKTAPADFNTLVTEIIPNKRHIVDSTFSTPVSWPHSPTDVLDGYAYKLAKNIHTQLNEYGAKLPKLELSRTTSIIGIPSVDESVMSKFIADAKEKIRSNEIPADLKKEVEPQLQFLEKLSNLNSKVYMEVSSNYIIEHGKNSIKLSDLDIPSDKIPAFTHQFTLNRTLDSAIQLQQADNSHDKSSELG